MRSRSKSDSGVVDKDVHDLDYISDHCWFAECTKYFIDGLNVEEVMDYVVPGGCGVVVFGAETLKTF